MIIGMDRKVTDTHNDHYTESGIVWKIDQSESRQAERLSPEAGMLKKVFLASKENVEELRILRDSKMARAAGPNLWREVDLQIKRLENQAK